MNFEHYKQLRNRLIGTMQSESAIDADVGDMHPLVLAYIGDAVFALRIRMRLLEREQRKVRVLHDVGAKMVSAVMQSYAFDCLLKNLTSEELAIAKRGRNAKSNVPKSATVREYRQSTAFETLLGYLFLCGHYQRLDELFELAFSNIAEKMVE